MTLLFKLVAALPLWLARAVGLALGWLAWGLSPRYRRLMRIHWDQARLSGRLGEAITQGGRPAQRAFRDAIGHAGLVAAELPKIWCDPAAVDRVQVQGYAQVEAIAKSGRGIIFLTPHLGAFELSSRWYARHAPITVLYRPAHKAGLRNLMDRLRPMHNMFTAPANASGVRQLIRALRNGQAVGMLPDQVPSVGEGIWAPFFGRPAYTMTLPIRLAQASQAAIVWALTVRTAGGWRLELEPWDQGPQLCQGPLEHAVMQMNAALEERIAKAPEQYLWAYNRYKTPKGAAAFVARATVDNPEP